MHFVSGPFASHVLPQSKNLNFKCGIVIDEQYSWMQGFLLKLPYNCHEYMQIDLSKNHRSGVFQGNINTECRQMVLSGSFSMQNSASRLSAIKEKGVPFGLGGTCKERQLWKDGSDNESPYSQIKYVDIINLTGFDRQQAVNTVSIRSRSQSIWWQKSSNWPVAKKNYRSKESGKQIYWLFLFMTSSA